MKINETYERTVIDLEFKPYTAIFRNNDTFEVVVTGFSNSDINEAIEQAEGALYDYLYKCYKSFDTDIASDVFKSYVLCEIKIS